VWRTAQNLTRRRLLCCAAVGSLVLAGCGSSGGQRGFASVFAGIAPQLRSLGQQLNSQVLHVGSTDYARLSSGVDAVGSDVNRLAGTVGGLNTPTADNTRVRDLHSSLGLVLSDLNDISAAAGTHNAAATTTAMAALHSDAATLASVEAELSQTLHLKSPA
jgi:hypothetical protein